jgi:hypothetical protein
MKKVHAKIISFFDNIGIAKTPKTEAKIALIECIADTLILHHKSNPKFLVENLNMYTAIILNNCDLKGIDPRYYKSSHHDLLKLADIAKNNLGLKENKIFQIYIDQSHQWIIAALRYAFR